MLLTNICHCVFFFVKAPDLNCFLVSENSFSSLNERCDCDTMATFSPGVTSTPCHQVSLYITESATMLSCCSHDSVGTESLSSGSTVNLHLWVIKVLLLHFLQEVQNLTVTVNVQDRNFMTSSDKTNRWNYCCSWWFYWNRPQTCYK